MMAPNFFLLVVLATLFHFSSVAGNKPSFRQYRRWNTRTQNSRQMPAPFNCVKSGFFADSKDCTRFYRCVDYYGTESKFTLFEFICAEGTIFDESLSVCNHPAWVNPTPPCWATTPGLNSTTGSGGGSIGPVTPPGSSSETPVTTVTTSSSSVSVAETTPSGPTVAPTELTTQTNPGISETTAASVSTESTSTSTTSNPPTQSGETSAPIVTESSAPLLIETTTSVPVTAEPFTATAPTVPPTVAPTVPPTDPPTPESSSSAPVTTPSTVSEVSPTEPSSAATTQAAPVTESIPTSPQTESTTTLGPVTPALPIAQPPTTAAPFMLTCNDEKFHRHPLRCDLYYKCIWTELSFSVDLRACSPGLHYDEDSGTCRTPGRTAACTFATLPPLPGVTTTDSLTTVTESTTTAITEATTTTTAEPSTTVTESTTTATTEATTTTTAEPVTTVTESTTTMAATTEATTTTTAEPVTTVTESTTTTTTTEVPSTSAEPTTAPPIVETTATTAPSVPTQYTLAPGSLYDCKRPGHYPYQLDCIRFYRCFEVQPTVLKGLLYRCPPDYAYSTVTERCVKQNTLPACDRNGIRLPMDFPVPIIKLEDTTMVQLEDFDSFFGNPNYFYTPRRKFKYYFSY